MKYGHFDDSAREYVIDTPHTPLPWINYLGSEDFFTLISNTAGGYSFYKDARLRRITRYRYNNNPLDMEGFRLYVKDGNTVWNPSWKPVCTQLDAYQCRHGLGYSIFTGEKNGIRVTQTMFVPRADNCLIYKVNVANTSGVHKTISLYGFVEFCLWDANDDSTNFQRNYSTGEVEVESQAIFHKTEYRERRNHYAVFWCSEKVADFDTDMDVFNGADGSASHPQAVFSGRCSNSIAHGWRPCAAQRVEINLEPGENKNIIFGLGYIENRDEEKWESKGVINKTRAREMIARYRNADDADKAFEDLGNMWKELLGRYSVHSSDSRMDRMVNIWNQYQCMVTFNMSRSASYFESGMGRGMGFRDSCQDILGFVHMVPDRARTRILDIAATQFPDGSAYHQYQPLTKRGNTAVGTGFNDDPLWLIAATDAYIRETGDFSILSESVPFDNNPSLSDSLYEHLRRSFRYTAEHLGPHSLPLIGRADWNDCLNLNCFSKVPGESFQTTGPSEGPVAESVFIAGMFVKYGKAYAQICRRCGKKDESESAEKAVEQMKKTVLEAGWDGEWFRRAYDAFGKPVGSSSCEEGKIFIEPQGMCVMAGIGVENGEAERALKSVGKYLDTKYGIILQTPAYSSYHTELGEISSYPPGVKENAGIFCHNNTWITCAEAVMNHGEEAWNYYRKICPAYLEDISEIHRTEPYVYAQMIAGRDSPRFGEAKNSFLTGTAAWTFVSISQAILGIIPDYDGLKIKPCLPEELKSLEIRRVFRKTEYRISIRQTGARSIRVNGEKVPSDIIPPSESCIVNVEVEV